jgi:hypothetical protein
VTERGAVTAEHADVDWDCLDPIRRDGFVDR